MAVVMRALAAWVAISWSLSLAAPAEKSADEKDSSAVEADSKTGCNCKSRAKYGCPRYPIGVFPGGTLYYADFFDPSCDAEPEPTHVFGDFLWPWVTCPDDCVETRDEEEKPARQGFAGLPAKVDFDYMHTHDGGGAFGLEGQQPGQSCFPGGPARHCCRVNKDLNNLFITFDVNGKRHAKVLQLEVNVEKAAFLPDQNNWRATYVAFEVAGKPPESEGYETIEVRDLTDVEPVSNPHVRKAVFRKGPGQLAKVIILLSR